MIDPVRHQQLMELDTVQLCTQILYNARNELYLNMRFLDISLSSLSYEADPGCRGIGTDGFVLFYRPEYLMKLHGDSRIRVNRAYLHMVLHCLFCHMDIRKERDSQEWNLACDVAVEAIMDGLYQRCTHIQPTAYRRELYQNLHSQMKVLTAEGIYKAVKGMNLSEKRRNRMEMEFYSDDHSYWEREDSPQKSQDRQENWKNNREKMQTDMETFSQEMSEDSESLMEQVRIENRERYDYKKFLRKFSVLKEEIEIDPDSFDYIFYTYGLSLYGNMPLVEPLETREVKRIEDFVIVIDTSMSCSGELVLRFLEETYTVLAESESYFRKINIHIIQCDEQIQSDRLITSGEEMRSYMEEFTVIGQGGTDFRPAFEYVNGLVAKGSFHKLRGLLYFTDGRGIYPVKMPVYDTAFVFLEDQYSDISVPSWAMKLILEPEDLDRKTEVG